jgi:hypothetical protein
MYWLSRVHNKFTTSSPNPKNGSLWTMRSMQHKCFYQGFTFSKLVKDYNMITLDYANQGHVLWCKKGLDDNIFGQRKPKFFLNIVHNVEFMQQINIFYS